MSEGWRDDAEAPWLDGGCHCGAVRFSVRPERLVALACNCSICSKKGFLHVIVPRARFRLMGGAEQLAEYSFGTHTARHLACRRCAVSSFYRPRSHPDGFSVNLRCLDEDPGFRVEPFDGRDWEANVESIR